jgi:hypothetical protein
LKLLLPKVAWPGDIVEVEQRIELVIVGMLDGQNRANTPQSLGSRAPFRLLSIVTALLGTPHTIGSNRITIGLLIPLSWFEIHMQEQSVSSTVHGVAMTDIIHANETIPRL